MAKNHHDTDEIGDEGDGIIPAALLDVVERLREDVTLMSAVIDLAGPEPAEPARANGAR